MDVLSVNRPKPHQHVPGISARKYGTQVSLARKGDVRGWGDRLHEGTDAGKRGEEKSSSSSCHQEAILGLTASWGVDQTQEERFSCTMKISNCLQGFIHLFWGVLLPVRYRKVSPLWRLDLP